MFLNRDRYITAKVGCRVAGQFYHYLSPMRAWASMPKGGLHDLRHAGGSEAGTAAQQRDDRMSTQHRHRALPDKSEDRGYTGPVALPANEGAHGNTCRFDVCRCGAERMTTINGRHREVGRWVDPQEDGQ